MNDRLARALSPEEVRLWHAAYTAAFVAHVRALEQSALEHPPAEGYAEQGGDSPMAPIDVAIANVTAEDAITIADAAVHRLRQWRDAENPDAGLLLGELPKEWDDGS